MKLRDDTPKEELAGENLPDLWQAFLLAKKMGPVLGSGALLQRPLPQRTPSEKSSGNHGPAIASILGWRFSCFPFDSASFASSDGHLEAGR